jgi:Carboxypeptidase regulatory-like domain
VRARLIVVAAFVVGLVACGGDSNPGPSGNPIITGLSITGPTQIAPGEIARFIATGKFSDGSTQDMTTRATWFSSGDVRRLAPGQFEGVQPGEAGIGAFFGRVSAQSQSLLILPPGTFKLSGAVTDASGLVEGVVVEARFGGGSKTVTTSRDGRYAFYGVSGAVELIASARGYNSANMRFTVTGPTVSNIILTTTATPLNLAGTWTLSLAASSPCSDSWPEAVRHLEEPTQITQDGTRLTLSFTGPTVQQSFVGSFGRIAGTEFSLTINFDDYYVDYGLLERPNPTDWVGVYGAGEASGNESAISGTFNGRFDYYITVASARFPQGVPKGCAANPEFTLRRQ